MLNRIKTVKDLLLSKLDDILHRLGALQEVAATRQDVVALTQRLDSLSEAQLKNETALLEASIHLLQRLEAKPQRPFLLLGNAQETAAVSPLLAANAASIQAWDWDWGQEVDLTQVPDQMQVILCKLPTEPTHWDSLKKLQAQVPGSLGVFALGSPIS